MSNSVQNSIQRAKRGSGERRPSAMANSLAKQAKATNWTPMITAMHATMRVPASRLTCPNWTGVRKMASAATEPKPARKSPGIRKSQRGE